MSNLRSLDVIAIIIKHETKEANLFIFTLFKTNIEHMFLQLDDYYNKQSGKFPH